MSYIIKNGEPVARTISQLKSGVVRVAYQKTTSGDLVNAFEALASNAKKWDVWEERHSTHLPIAELTAQGVYIR